MTRSYAEVAAQSAKADAETMTFLAETMAATEKTEETLWRDATAATVTPAVTPATASEEKDATAAPTVEDPLAQKRKKTEAYWATVAEIAKRSTLFKETYSIVYRGHSIDGWMAAFLAYTALSRPRLIGLYPVTATRTVSDQQAEKWKGSHVLFLDLSVDRAAQAKLMAAGALSVSCIDHHETALGDWEEGVIQVGIATAFQTWLVFFPGLPVPYWIDAVARLSLWKSPTWEDRCLREVLLPIAHLPAWEALYATEDLVRSMVNPMCAAFQARMTEGQERLVKKDEELLDFLQDRGRTHVIGVADVEAWGLGIEWLGLSVFLLENTNHVIDTNEAAHLVFHHAPYVEAFVNMRRRTVHDRQGKRVVYVYSARSRMFDLTQGGFFQGHRQSAGAQAPVKEKRFVIDFSSSFQ